MFGAGGAGTELSTCDGSVLRCTAPIEPRAARNSAALPNRSPRNGAMARSRVSATSSDSSLRSPNDRGSAAISPGTGRLAENGYRPVRTSYSVTPSAYTSRSARSAALGGEAVLASGGAYRAEPPALDMLDDECTATLKSMILHPPSVHTRLLGLMSQ